MVPCCLGVSAHLLKNVCRIAQITEDDAWQIFHFECAAPGGPAHGLQARILASKRQRGDTLVEFQTQGSLTDTEVDIITAAMRAANTVVQKVTNSAHVLIGDIPGA